MALQVECPASDWQVAGLTPTQALLHNNLRQVVHTLVQLKLALV